MEIVDPLPCRTFLFTIQRNQLPSLEYFPIFSCVWKGDFPFLTFRFLPRALEEPVRVEMRARSFRELPKVQAHGSAVALEQSSLACAAYRSVHRLPREAYLGLRTS
jgi:hypothetical protein